MALRGKDQVWTKISLDNVTIEQVSHFNFLGCDVSNTYDNDVDNKLHKYQLMCGTIHRTLRHKTRQDTRLKFYKTMATPVLTYGCETWTTRTRDRQRIQAAEMKFLRQTKGCTLLDHIRNNDIRRDLNIYNINDKIQQYKTNWIEHVHRKTNSLVRHTLQGQRQVGRPIKRYLQ